MKTVLITGASRGIGAALARQLVVKGFRVVGVARSGDALKRLAEEKLGGEGRFEYVVGDITDPSVQEAAVKEASEEGVLVGVILNAGSVGPISPVAGLDYRQVQRTVELNFTCNLNLCRLSIPHLRQSGGTVIALTSGAVEYPSQGMSVYCCSKAALNMLVQVLAKEEPAITVIGVRPGIVDTDMLSNTMACKDLVSQDQRLFLETARAQAPWEPAEKIADLLGDPNAQSISGNIIDTIQL